MSRVEHELRWYASTDAPNDVSSAVIEMMPRLRAGHDASGAHVMVLIAIGSVR